MVLVRLQLVPFEPSDLTRVDLDHPMISHMVPLPGSYPPAITTKAPSGPFAHLAAHFLPPRTRAPSARQADDLAVEVSAVRREGSPGSGEPPPRLHPIQTQPPRPLARLPLPAQRSRAQIPHYIESPSILRRRAGHGFHEGLRSDRAGDVSFLDRATGHDPVSRFTRMPTAFAEFDS